MSTVCNPSVVRSVVILECTDGTVIFFSNPFLWLKQHIHFNEIHMVLNRTCGVLLPDLQEEKIQAAT